MSKQSEPEADYKYLGSEVQLLLTELLRFAVRVHELNISPDLVVRNSSGTADIVVTNNFSVTTDNLSSHLEKSFLDYVSNHLIPRANQINNLDKILFLVPLLLDNDLHANIVFEFTIDKQQINNYPTLKGLEESNSGSFPYVSPNIKSTVWVDKKEIENVIRLLEDFTNTIPTHKFEHETIDTPDGKNIIFSAVAKALGLDSEELSNDFLAEEENFTWLMYFADRQQRRDISTDGETSDDGAESPQNIHTENADIEATPEEIEEQDNSISYAAAASLLVFGTVGFAVSLYFALNFIAIAITAAIAIIGVTIAINTALSTPDKATEVEQKLNRNNENTVNGNGSNPSFELSNNPSLLSRTRQPKQPEQPKARSSKSVGRKIKIKD